MFVAKVFTPYLLKEGGVAWRKDMPVIIFASNLEKAIADLKLTFSVRVPEIEAKLATRSEPEQKMYYHVEMVEVPKDISGAQPLYSIIASHKVILFSSPYPKFAYFLFMRYYVSH